MPWIKFQKGHPAFAYFVGDVVELKKETIAEHQLLKLGYAVNAEEEEIEAAIAAIEAEQNAAPRVSGGIVGLQELIAQQAAQIKQLTEMQSAPVEKPAG